MAKTVKGFGVRNQDRQKVRSDLSGSYGDHNWFIRSEYKGLFTWSIGEMIGHGGPSLGDVLRTMKKASKAQDQLQEVYGEGQVPRESFNDLRLLNRWEQKVLAGRIKITGPHGSGDKAHFRVTEHPVL